MRAPPPPPPAKNLSLGQLRRLRAKMTLGLWGKGAACALLVAALLMSLALPILGLCAAHLIGGGWATALTLSLGVMCVGSAMLESGLEGVERRVNALRDLKQRERMLAHRSRHLLRGELKLSEVSAAEGALAICHGVGGLVDPLHEQRSQGDE